MYVYAELVQLPEEYLSACIFMDKHILSLWNLDTLKKKSLQIKH